MKKWMIILTITALAATLAACGGNNKENNQKAPVEQTEQTNNGQAGEGNAAEQPAEEGESEPAEQTPDNSGSEEGRELPKTSEIDVTVEGVTEKRPATLAESSEQDYYLYVLQQFELTAEEPGRDMLFAKEYPEYYVRIERLESGIDEAELKANAEEELKALGDVFEQKGDQIFDEKIRESKFFLHAGDSKLSKNIFLLEMGGVPFKFTVNIPNGEPAEGLSPSLYAMIKSMIVK